MTWEEVRHAIYALVPDQLPDRQLEHVDAAVAELESILKPREPRPSWNPPLKHGDTYSSPWHGSVTHE